VKWGWTFRIPCRYSQTPPSCRHRYDVISAMVKGPITH